MSNYIGGWLFDRENHEELAASSISASVVERVFAQPFSIPNEIDPRSWSRIRNQGQEGSCQGHSLTAAQEMCHYAKAGAFRQFSPDYAYYRTQAYDGLLGRDSGSTISGGVKVARELGALPEELMPYSQSYSPRSVPANADYEAQPYKVAQHAILRSFSDVVNWLGRGLGGVSWGIRWNAAPDSQGYVKRFSPGNGGHATGLLGYGPLDSTGMPDYLWLKNSWGTGWGLSGWCKYTREAFEQACRDQYTVIGAISDMSEIKPRDFKFVEKSIRA